MYVCKFIFFPSFLLFFLLLYCLQITAFPIFPSSCCSLLPVYCILRVALLHSFFFASRCSIFVTPSLFLARSLLIAPPYLLVVDCSSPLARCRLLIPARLLLIAPPCSLVAHCSSVLARYSLLPIASD